ncbi:MAG: DUF1592 domain-containing protein [Deltaproteobacteria bacterium]
MKVPESGFASVNFTHWDAERAFRGRVGVGGRRIARRCALAASLALAGCSKEAVSESVQPYAPGNANVGNGAEVPPEPGSVTSSRCAPRGLEARAVWLSDIQFANAIRSLFGPTALDGAQVPDASLKPFSQKGVVVNTSLLRTRLDLAQRAASSVRDRFTQVTSCAATDDACARGYLQRLAEQAFRRPVEQGEFADLMLVYEEGSATDIPTGVELTLHAILAAPSFSYRTEFGSGTPDAAGRVVLSDMELGSLLSFWLTDAPPDQELRTAMTQGRLSDRSELERQVARLVSSPEAQNSLTLTLMSAWDMGNLFGATKDPGLFPAYGPLLQSNMFEETRLFLNQVLWGPSASLGQVLTSRQSYVNQALADLYDVPFTGTDPTQFVPALLPEGERAGLLTQASFLAGRARSDNTSVVARGLFVRSAVLCLQRPPPPPEAVLAQVQALLAADLTERERADFRAMTSPCSGCHIAVDPFGLMLENYDPIGRFREELDGEAIDATVDLTSVGFPGTFVGAVEFAAAAAESTDFSACVARHLAVYATGNDAVATNDCDLAPFKQMVPDQTNMRDIVTALASSSLLGTRTGVAQ